MTTQREPDTSAEGLGPDVLAALRAVAEGYPVRGVEDRFIVVENPDFRPDNGEDPNLTIDVYALADAAGQAAPVPPPVEGLETTDEVRKQVCRGSGSYPDGAALYRDFGRLAKEVANLTRMLTVTGDERDHLAKEVERLQRQVAPASGEKAT